ncbi:MAG: UPF0179 family protein [Candidatus Methanomethylophilaceae archaeon]
MVLLTLIGEHQAQPGRRFLYLGPLSECKDCRLRGVCFNLESGCTYEVTAVRDAKHDCAIYEDKARVVEVEKRPTLAAVGVKTAIEGSTITLESVKCDNLACENYTLCHPHALRPGDKVKVIEVVEDLICPEGGKLVRASLL